QCSDKTPNTAYSPVEYDVSKQTQRIDILQSSTKELFTPLDNPKRVFLSKRRLFETPGLVELDSPEFDLFSNIKERSEEEATKFMTDSMEQYMSKTRGDYRSGVTRPKINTNTHFKLKGKFLKELRDNTFTDSEHEDENEHIKKVLEIVDLFHILNITQDQIMLRAFLVSLTRAASHWLRNEPVVSILTQEILKSKFLSKYCPPAHTAKKMEEVILFYNVLDVPTRQILDSKGAVPTMNTANAKVAIQKMAEYSQNWHNGTSTKSRSTETSDGLAAIQA
ncbi:hypothetical protein Tco_0946094, partial [Tanacetum coccineum]